MIGRSRSLCVLVLCLLYCTSCSPVIGNQVGEAEEEQVRINRIVEEAKRIPNSTKWFEVLRLPNRVYAFWEPGHAEKVNSFLVIGRERDLLYDTGMGIASIARAIHEVRAMEGLPQHEIMVVNSHNHLDHNGGNQEFDTIWTVDDPWALNRLAVGVPATPDSVFVGYWAALTPHKGVVPPASFSPDTHAIPPFDLVGVRFLEDGQLVDLGDRAFRVIRTYSHSPDGVALHSDNAAAGEAMFFGGDAFYGADYLVTDLALLASDLQRIQPLRIDWHYTSHGAQLLVAMQQGAHLAAVERLIAGEGQSGTTQLAGLTFPLREIDSVRVTLAKDFLLY